MTEPLLSVCILTGEFTIRGGVVPVRDDLSFELAAGETLSLVGESGCGKSMTALAIMGLIPSPPGTISAGSIPVYWNNTWDWIRQKSWVAPSNN